MSVDLATVDPKVLAATQPSLQQTSDEQLRKFEGYVAEIFAALGWDMNTPAGKDALQRFIRSLFSVTRGMRNGPDALKLLGTRSQSGAACREVHVIEGPIRFWGLCERHSFLLFGYAHVGYVAREQIMETCKLARLVQRLTMRFMGQETARLQIADSLQTLLYPSGVAVHLEVDHSCAPTHERHHSESYTMVWRGSYSLDPALRAEFLKACELAQ